LPHVNQFRVFEWILQSSGFTTAEIDCQYS